MSTERHENPRLLAAAEALASRQAVDWERLREECGEAAVGGLRAIEKLLGRASGADPAWPEPGSQWRHLCLRSQLGAGGDGVVYRAFDALLERDVALKLRLLRTPSTSSRLAEGQRMARVDHPNVLKVHGVAEDGGFLGLWSDLVEGESLVQWVEEGRRLGAAELVTLGSELCAALAAIHQAGLVHGDVKPGNVIRANNGRFVLVDFGASVLIGDVDKICGTPLYLAPEVLDGGLPSVASDVYSLGALLFRLASGQPPVMAESFSDLVERHRGNDRKRLLDLRPDLPPHLVGILESALQPEPSQRPRSAGELAAQLGDCLPRSPQRWSRKAIAATVLLIVALAAAWAAFAPRGVAPVGPNVHFVRTGGSFETGLSDGASIAPGDTFALDLRLPESAFVYVINEDARGESFQLFPLKTARLQNPLPAQAEVRLPGDVDGSPLDWQVTSRGGMEHFYVLLSPHAIPELESGRMFDLASRGLSVDYADALADEPRRGAGGLGKSARGARTDSALAAWIRSLRARDSAVRVEQIALNNP